LGSRRLRFLDCQDNEYGKVVSPKHRPS